MYLQKMNLEEKTQKIVVHPHLESKNYNENVNKETFLEKEKVSFS